MKKHIVAAALALTGVLANAGTAPSGAVTPGVDCKKPACNNCGRVMGVRVHTQDGQSNALGLVGGGAAGALLGNQVGSGNGRALATIAGAVGGAYAGKRIQEHANRTKVWTVDVEYDNGKRGAFRYDHNPGVQRGDRVRKSGNDLIRM